MDEWNLTNSFKVRPTEQTLASKAYITGEFLSEDQLSVCKRLNAFNPTGKKDRYNNYHTGKLNTFVAQKRGTDR